MSRYEGIAVNYMSMPMAAQSLPLMGTCAVDDKKIALKFPLTSVSFDLPASPSEGGAPLEFKMAGPKAEMTLKIIWKPELRAFFGQGVQGDSPVLTFLFYKSDNPLKLLKQL